MPHWIDIHQRALRGERFDMREDCWTRADGQKEWNQWAIHPWMDADGQVGGIVMFTEVITAQEAGGSGPAHQRGDESRRDGQGADRQGAGAYRTATS